MQRLFKNANLVDLKTGELSLVDLLVNDGKFEKISKLGEIKSFVGESVDLEGNFVFSPFVNAFCNALEAFETTYSKNYGKDVELINNLMKVKNLLAGAICNDISCINEFDSVCFEDFEDKEEKDFGDFLKFVCDNKKNLFVKAGQTLQELGTVDLKYKKSLSYVLEDFGFLDRSPTIVGGNCFEKDDLDLFSQYDCSFCLIPSEDGKVGRRTTNLISLLSKDFCVALGSGNSFEIDFFAFMRQLLMTQRGLFESVDCLDERQVFEIATVFGAKVLGLKNFGVAVGNCADFVVVSKSQSLYENALKSLVWEKSKKDIVMTVLKGEILQKNGKIFMKNVDDCDTIVLDIKQILG